MPRALRGCSLHVRCTGLADVGGSNDRPRLYPVTRSHPEIRVELQQGRTRKMGDTHRGLAEGKPRRARVLRQRCRRGRPAKRAYTSGDARLNTVGTGLRNATGSFSLHAQGESDARTRSHSKAGAKRNFARSAFGMRGVFAPLLISVSRFELV